MKRLVVSTLFIGLVAVGAFADKEAPSGTATRNDGMVAPTRGTVWIQYDDGTVDQSADDITPNDTVGNHYEQTAAWGTFYCQQLNVFQVANNTAFSVTYYAGLNTAGTALTGHNYINVGVASTATNTWWLIDGSSTAIDWIGNPSSSWTGTAYLAAYNSGTDTPGLDTSGSGPFHGFSLSSYNGSGYTTGNFHAMIRAQFAGDSVPVELMNLVVE